MSYSKAKKCSRRKLKSGKIEVISRRFTVGQTHFKISPKGYESPKGKKSAKRKIIKWILPNDNADQGVIEEENKPK